MSEKPAASSQPPKVPRKEGESDLDYSLRKRKTIQAWKRRQEDIAMGYASESEDSESESPDEEDSSLLGTIKKAFNRSERELEKIGE